MRSADRHGAVLATSWPCSAERAPLRCDFDAVERVIAAGPPPDFPWAQAAGTARCNAVERVMIGYGWVQSARSAAAGWAVLDGLGVDVGPRFADAGADVHAVARTAAALAAGADCDALALDACHRALGRTWEAALDGPSGFAEYIARSAAGMVAAENAFFAAAPPPALPAAKRALFLRRCLDLLAEAIASRRAPHRIVGATFAPSDWRQRVSAVLDPATGRRFDVHACRSALSDRASRRHVLFADAAGDVVGEARAVCLRGDTGMFDELVDHAADGGASVRAIVEAVFAPAGAIGIHPRLRRLLAAADDRVHAIAVVEGCVVDAAWRGRSVALALVRQLLVECGACDLVLGRPAAFVDAGGVLPFEQQAAHAAARLRLARYARRLDAGHLLDGVMGMDAHAVERQVALGMRERQASA